MTLLCCGVCEACVRDDQFQHKLKLIDDLFLSVVQKITVTGAWLDKVDAIMKRRDVAHTRAYAGCPDNWCLAPTIDF